MSNENQSSIGSYLAFPLAITGLGAVKSVVQNKGIRPAIKSLGVSTFKEFNKTLDKDIFTKGIINAENYAKYKELAKAANKDKLSLFQRFLNIFRSDAKKRIVDANSIKEAREALKTADNALKNGTSIATVAKSTKSAAETAIKTGFSGNVKSLFKKEATSKLTWVFTAIEALPEIKNKIIPAFKNEGFGAGLKQIGKSILKVGSSFLSFTLGGALGRVIGGAIGTLICPGAGSAVGANIGSMISMAISGKVANKAVEKITGEKEEQERVPKQGLNMEA